jgi:hypothetical protein
MADKPSEAMAVPAAMPGARQQGEVVEGVPKPKYDWMGLRSEWHVRAKPGAHGLRLSDLNIGIYGEAPEEWDDATRRPRGALPRPGVPPLPYNLRKKHQLWADSAADLYEEAIQRRWVPATDVPWNTLAPLPEDVERAMCQVCTELSQFANTEIEIIAYWQDQMSYGYYEVKQFLATETFSATRLIEALRKRALANGGGLGVESRGLVNRMILESRGGWTESAVYLYLLRGTYTLHILRSLLLAAHNPAEQFIFSKAIEDHARNLSYGYDHLKYAVTHQPSSRDVMQTLLTIGEVMVALELEESPMRHALAIVFGGGIAGGRTIGMQTYRHMVAEYLRDYLDLADWLGVPRRGALHPMLKKYLDA